MVVFYVTSTTVLLYSISSTEISEGGKCYSPINVSVGINMVMNGRLDLSSFLTFICARLKFQNCALIETLRTRTGDGDGDGTSA